MIRNETIAELLLKEAETAEGHREKAFRGAAHAAFMWPVEAEVLFATGRPLTELAAIGPSLSQRLKAWIEHSPPIARPPAIRREFLTLARARRILARNPNWRADLKGDLQMHSEWSDGSSTIAEMADGGIARNYRYFVLTDQTKGLKIADGLEESGSPRRREIVGLNQPLRCAGKNYRVMLSELNLSPVGEGDMDPKALAKLDLVPGCVHSGLSRIEDRTERYIAGLRNPDLRILGHPQTRVHNRRVGLECDWNRVFGAGGEAR